ncbi:MAG TPA: amidohydrolase [Chloroflexia bacterium]|nr:amidohydrolase [Chloroflexia bacterium]
MAEQATAVTVLRDVRVYTMNPRQPEAAALAWRGERLLAVGPADAVLVAAGPGARVVDGGGRTVLPGLIDAHIHFMWYAAGLLRVDLEGAPSREAALERVADRVARTAPGAWVRGSGWNNHLWTPDGFPTRQDLDRVTGAHPAVMTRKDGHSIWVNSAALAAAGITRDTADPPGGRIGRAPDGEPDGMLYEGAALRLVYPLVPDESAAERDAAVRRGLAAVAAAGLTGFHDLESPEAFAAFQQLDAAGALPVRVVMALALATLPESIAVGLRSGFGSSRLRVGPVKIFSDGSLGSQTAEMLAPFTGTSDNYGVPTIGQADLEAAILAASAAGIAVAVHAIGDAANRRTLDALARARQAESGPAPLPPGPGANGYTLYGLRHRIEHAQLVDPADWPRFRELGVIASMQPIHATSDMHAADRLWGARCGQGAYAWRSLQRAGARLAFGSDCPVETFDPWRGIHAAVTRQDAAGTPPGGWYPQERLSVVEAVRAYTLGAAYAAGEEQQKGSLAPGKLADLVLLDQDIVTGAPATIPHTRVTTTIVGGDVVAGSL